LAAGRAGYGHLTTRRKEPAMLFSARPGRRTVMGAISVGTLAGAMLFGAAANAGAQPQPAPPVPPPCTAAELARVMSGVSFDTSNYLSTHPDVDDFSPA
jgi:hypothetical protein